MNITGVKTRLLSVGVHLFRNNRNEHKYIEVAIRKGDNHYYYKNFTHWDNGVTNILGWRRNAYRKITRHSLEIALEDYTEIPVDYTILP